MAVTKTSLDSGESRANEKMRESSLDNNSDSMLPNTYWFTRVILLRSISFIYLIAFIVGLNQNKGLIGSQGILPADQFMNRVKKYFGGSDIGLHTMVPTVLWFVDYEGKLDYWLDLIATAGIVVSLGVLISGTANIIIMMSLWLLYHSLVNVGQDWYSFGWESQLLETGFLAIFICPFFRLSSLECKEGPSIIFIGAFRWLIFRIMIGAGLIKIRGDSCWRDLTCMNYHYLTQPVPNPISPFLHASPVLFHKFEVLTNHIVELVIPFLLIPVLPRWCRNVCGFFQVFFQVVLIISGNLSFLNWLTIVPSLACFDDLTWKKLFSSDSQKMVILLQQKKKKRDNFGEWALNIRRTANLLVGCIIAYLSIPVVMNLFSSNQAMNTSFEPFRLVNTYGAFGSITKHRKELILQGTNSSDEFAHDKHWLTYEFKCKPGDPNRRPCLISPYHYRLDWLMWFAAFQPPFQNEWLIKLGMKLMKNNAKVGSLLAHNPFGSSKKGPRYLRIVFYDYKYCPLFGQAWNEGQWWCRTKLKSLFWPPMGYTDLKNRLRS